MSNGPSGGSSRGPTGGEGLGSGTIGRGVDQREELALAVAEDDQGDLRGADELGDQVVEFGLGGESSLADPDDPEAGREARLGRRGLRDNMVDHDAPAGLG